MDAGQARAQAGARRNIDDAAKATLLHVTGTGLGTPEGAVHIGLKHHQPILLGNVFNRASDLSAHTPCTIHQNVEAAKLLRCAVNSLGHAAALCQINGGSQAGTRCTRSLQPRAVDVKRRHLHALRHKGLHDAQSNALRGTRHDGPTAREMQVHAATIRSSVAQDWGRRPSSMS